jgi:hypothetical protein
MPRVMPKKKFLALVQRFTAIQAVGPSSVRGQPKKTLEKIHGYLGRLRLRRLAGRDSPDYRRWLDTRTRQLQKRLGGRKEQWGIARKAMNLFMRSCLYNTYLSREFHLARFRRHMEIPLDSAVARGLKEESKKEGQAELPLWRGLIGLDSERSREFQQAAEKRARKVGLPGRVFLDNYLWPKYRKSPGG